MFSWPPQPRSTPGPRPLPGTKESLLNSWRQMTEDADIVVEVEPTHPTDVERELAQVAVMKSLNPGNEKLPEG